jgi:UDP-glucuronate 4-epimerase
LGHTVVGLDNLNSYYDPELKEFRNSELSKNESYHFIQGDINDHEILSQLGKKFKITSIYHLAAQAGVRLAPSAYKKYIHSNVSGFTEILSFAVSKQIPNFIYASSSSVYGNTADLEFNEDSTETVPTSYYGGTKLFNESIARVMVRNSATRARGLRYFTVYGEMGRPDMAYFRIANAILNNQKFTLYGNGDVRRDFTYIDDVVNATLLLGGELASRNVGYADVVNVGGGRPVSMRDLIDEISKQLGQSPKIGLMAANENDVELTKADSAKLRSLTGFTPETTIEQGISNFLDWASPEETRERLNRWVESAP